MGRHGNLYIDLHRCVIARTKEEMKRVRRTMLAVISPSGSNNRVPRTSIRRLPPSRVVLWQYSFMLASPPIQFLNSRADIHPSTVCIILCRWTSYLPERRDRLRRRRFQSLVIDQFTIQFQLTSNVPHWNWVTKLWSFLSAGEMYQWAVGIDDMTMCWLLLFTLHSSSEYNQLQEDTYRFGTYNTAQPRML